MIPGPFARLDFGTFDVLAGLFRLLGADCGPLFRKPLQSKSLGEFWGGRWNLAFSEMTAIAVYRPVSQAMGPSAGVLAAFLFSGVLHELAISVSVRAGLGLTLLYFTLHAALILIERRLERRGRPVHERPWIGRIWTAGWLVGPLPILLHPPFVRAVVWPLIGMG